MILINNFLSNLQRFKSFASLTSFASRPRFGSSIVCWIWDSERKDTNENKKDGREWYLQLMKTIENGIKCFQHVCMCAYNLKNFRSLRIFLSPLTQFQLCFVHISKQQDLIICQTFLAPCLKNPCGLTWEPP
jgi:hypothetical protein